MTMVIQGRILNLNSFGSLAEEHEMAIEDVRVTGER